MVFDNVVAYCKGWYKSVTKSVDKMWVDFAHCIMADGGCIYTKEDVARYCLTKFEQFAKKYPNDAWMVSIGMVYTKIKEHERYMLMVSHGQPKPLSMDDHIIWMYRDFIRYLDADYFKSGYIPSREVLPVVMHDAYIDEEGWHPAEMYSEAIERIKNVFPNFVGQDFKYSVGASFEDRQARLKY